MNTQEASTERHYEMTDECITTGSGEKPYRIRCTKDIPGVVKAGDLGGRRAVIARKRLLGISVTGEEVDYLLSITE
jgi:hypothetical protein